MADFQFDQGQVITDLTGGLSGASLGLLLVPAAGENPNAKQAYQQITAATTVPAQAMTINLATGNIARDYLVDISVGAAAAEIVLFSNLQHGTGGMNRMPSIYRLPCDLPVGVRLAARMQCTDDEAVDVLDLTVHLHSAGPYMARTGEVVDTYGANTADSGGTTITSGVSNAKGGYAIIGTLLRPTKALYLYLGNQGDGAVTNNDNVAIDIAIGAPASEVIIFADLQTGRRNVSEQMLPQMFGPFLCDLPVGTVLSVAAASSAAVLVETFDAIIYAIS